MNLGTVQLITPKLDAGNDLSAIKPKDDFARDLPKDREDDRTISASDSAPADRLENTQKPKEIVEKTDIIKPHAKSSQDDAATVEKIDPATKALIADNMLVGLLAVNNTADPVIKNFVAQNNLLTGTATAGVPANMVADASVASGEAGAKTVDAAQTIVAAASAAKPAQEEVPAAIANAADAAILDQFLATDAKQADLSADELAALAKNTKAAANGAPKSESPSPAAIAPNLSSPDDAAGAPSLQAAAPRPETIEATVKKAVHVDAPATVDTKAGDAAAPNAAIPQQVAAPLHNDKIEIKAAPVQIAAHAPASEQVAFQIVKLAKTGTDRIKIQLSPEDLGRVDIRLDMHKDGSVKAVISADRPETAAWLERDAKQLERALQDAGLKTDSNSLEFSNRGQQQSHHAFSQMQEQNSGFANKYQPNVKYATVEVPVADGAARSGFGGKAGVNILV